ncbi:ABC transporter ATP-binding protein [Streptomyces sp. TLI_171]|uniref:ABC transporter ATP-binding protein n=1 Tax=Streptomyces sp. TLI_171 TaxID=1938859 RepID=UPI000C19D1CD|nr:ABC transporter ATP-binding protein [Streptomyces sp. TLI_171]RKE17506.1 ABC-2 type transport system ATP-binding protein [Streptomyces sp. TLI_171]
MKASTDGRFAIEATALGKHFRRDRWALRDCGFAVPTGRVCGIVGPNGAGKSTLLALAAGLLTPSEGELRVLGTPMSDRTSRAASAELRGRVAFVGQDRPLYRSFTVADTLRLGRELNPRWDQAAAEQVIALGELRLDAKVGSLSGGQRSRVALALALGKRAELVLLDEPLADVDPLGRHDLMGVLLADVAERGTTALISSHLVSELEDVIDHVLLVHSGRIRLAGGLDELLDGHRLVSGLADAARPPGEAVEWRVTGRQATGLLRTGAPLPAPWESARPRLDELLLAYLRNPADGPAAPPGTRPLAAAGSSTTQEVSA